MTRARAWTAFAYARNSSQRLTDVARPFVNSATADFPPPLLGKNADTFSGQ